MASVPELNVGIPAPAKVQQDKVGQPETDTEEVEAYQYWGYLFKPDKTGTDKLKSLLRGLKDVVNEKYQPGDSPDLTPNQLAHFYRELSGNYDQLFLAAPSESIAFIYKSLGCLHSLQPLPHSAFTDPTIPSLKTEGWIMWQTIQLLLAPDEHSSFLMQAVQKWDVKDPVTKEILPKIIPRRCFPLEPDKHMVDWYMGVSERLRTEAEDEARHRQLEAEQAHVRRLHDKKREDTDDEGSIDSRGPALAYFRDPLYRHSDGRPTIVRNSSKRPQLSPRRTSMKDKGKDAATTVGHVIRNIGSPHLWEGRTPTKGDDRDRERRRRSLPDNRFHQQGEPPASAGYRPASTSHHQHRRSGPPDSAGITSPSEGETTPRRHRQHEDEYDPTLRHSRSHEPTPSQKEITDYFQGYQDQGSGQGSEHNSNLTPPAPNAFGPSFGPSASPLFASHVAKQPQPQQHRPPPNSSYAPPRQPPPGRHSQDRPYSRSPDRGSRHRARDDRRHESRDSRSHHDQSPRRRHDDGRSSANPMSPSQPGFPPVGGPPYERPPSGAPSGQGGYAPPRRVPSRERRRSNRMSGSDLSYSGQEDRNGNRKKQTRFAAGVDGRTYPNESPWR